MGQDRSRGLAANLIAAFANSAFPPVWSASKLVLKMYRIGLLVIRSMAARIFRS